MIRIFTCINIAVLSFVSAAAQSTFIGAEVSYVSDIYKVDDPGGYMVLPTLDAALYGLKVRHVVTGPLFLETGVYARMFREGFSFQNENATGGSGRRAVMLPLRAGLRFPLLNKHLYIAPVAGYVLGLAENGEVNWGYGTWSEPGGASFDYDYTMRYPVQTFSMLQGGLGIDVRIFQKAFLSFTGNYYVGMNKLWIQDMQYTVSGVEYNAKGYVKGSGYSIGIGFSYPIDRASRNIRH